MNRSPLATGISAVLAALALALAAGCGRAAAERRDAGDRYLRRARTAQQAEDVDGAIAWCEKALRRRPDSAPAHRELALMYDHFKQDYLAALYHYRRYLELRPASAERADVEEMMAVCGRALAAQLLAAGPVQPPPPVAAAPAVAPAAPPVAPAAALMALQYQNVGLAPLWSLLQVALLEPGAEAWIDAGPEPLARYGDGEVRIAMLSPQAWRARNAPQEADSGKLERGFIRFQARQRQYAAVLEVHGVPVQFVHCGDGNSDCLR